MPLDRSAQMARIRSKDTSPELEIRRRLWNAGFRYRLHHRVEGCRPDLVFLGARLCVFVDGCFWHGCPAHYVPPRSSRSYWRKKLSKNVARDRRQTLRLEESGWRVLRIWEHELMVDPEGAATRVARAVLSTRRPRLHEARVDHVRFLDRKGNREERHLVALRSGKCVGVVQRRRSTTKF